MTLARRSPYWFLLLSLSVSGHAQLAPPPHSTDTLAELPLEQLMELPVESVSGVSKYQQTIRQAPAGVTVFTANDIRNYGWRTLADALRAAPGFHVRNDRFYDYVGNRGFTRPYDYNSRTLILLDGHRMNDSIYQTGSIGTDFILDLEMVDRIEFISGPGSSVYGSSAFYGAVNVIPKSGRDLVGAQASLAVGDQPSGKARVSVGDRTENGVEYTVSATQWWSRGEEDFDLPQAWRDADPAFTADKAHNRDDMHHQSAFGRVSWRGFTAEAGYVERKKEVLPPVYFTNVDTNAYGIDQRAYALLRASGEPTPDSSLSAKIAFDRYHYEGLFTPLVTNFEQQEPYATGHSINTEVRWRQTIADRHTLIAGVEYQENLQQDLGRNNRSTGESPVRVREDSRYVSPFAQLDWELVPSLRASLGGRYDYYDTGDERLTPRVGLLWDATTSTTFKLLYGESFRVPNIEERYAGEAGIVVNPELGPETNRSWEFVAEHRINSVWRLDGHLYHTVSSDLITTVSTNNPADPDEITFANVQRYITQGMDIGTTAYFPSGLQFRASGTLQRTYDDDTNSVVADAPRTLLKLHLSAPIYEKWLRASGELLYVGDREDGLGEDTGDYLTANATLRASRIWHRWDLAFSVYNLADARWSDPINEGQITSPPRSFVLRAMLDF